ncbi:MAG: HAD-IIIC family phosphatase [Bacteroidetes bacterium]|nr:MAG: HAD-IIIC family phosphatase [Bacteroidota bacterium]
MQERDREKDKMFKAIVWDLDHTLWHGVLTENDELKLRDRMEHILETLDKRGILHSIASKNNYDETIARLEELGLRKYFLYPQITWARKSESIRIIQEKLNIGMDTIAFIDDQAFEREEAAFSNPELSTFDVDVIENILEMPEFMPRFITEESARRRLMYVDDEKRKEEEDKWGNTDIEFMKSQEMEFRISQATEVDLQRVEELTVRTNQLNASGYTYSYNELAELLQSPKHLLYVAELTDKFGSYGKIGVAMVEMLEDGNWNLKSLLMSCRVMSRGVGNVLLYYIINEARRQQKELFTEFLQTDRNRLMYVTLKFAGFKEFGDKLDNGRNLLRLEGDQEYNYPEYLKLGLPETVS